ncbi:uncharacterized protein FIESC28_09941 [Fusarium coffeatum]|uniref:Transcription factor domain-containing protein n=1 Tax=Fusarium coffeatum TaxID=231269 RepID=A0A366QWS8_9HYPO|nr:uncharacterized protein FIESC28_09941 [Fusarium coffeatum]RBR09333.1 hypothetical protein FIESC28_09941 [Fusarium coffeatum]
MSTNEASQAVHQMRAAGSILSASEAAIARQPQLYRPSELRTIHGILPPTESVLEFELNARHPFAYPPLEPLDLKSVAIDGWFCFEDQPFARNRPSPRNHSTPEETGTRILSVATSEPMPDWQLCDSRLTLLDMAYWSKIPIDNPFVSRILSHFLTAHFPLFPCFDMNLFLDDMIQRNTDCCSTFLVASIMSIACQSFSAFDIRSAPLSISFEQEARLLWETERHNDSSTNLAAMAFLSMSGGMAGREELMLQTLADIRAMAARMNLFGIRVSDEALKFFHELPPDKFRALASAAWGAYGWLTFYSTHYAADPINYPPALPVPGDTNRQSGGLVWPPHPIPEFLGHNITNICKLWPIIQGFGHVYSFTNPVPLSERVTLAFAESTYQKFLAWADALDLKMKRNDNSVSHVYFFHALYHASIVRLFQPFLHASAHTRLKSFNSRDCTPASIYMASIRQLKRLLIWYLTNAGRHSDNGWFTVAVLQVMSATLWNTNAPDWKVYFQLCFNFWKEAYIRYRIYLNIAKANLYFALQLGVIERDTAVAMVNELRAVGAHHVDPENAINRAIADHQIAAKDFKDSKVDAMANEFTDLTVSHRTGDVECNTDDAASSHESEVAPSHNWLKTVLN